MTPPSMKHLIIGIGKVAGVLAMLAVMGIGVDAVFRLPGFLSFPSLLVGVILLAFAVLLEAWATFTLWEIGHGTPNPTDPPRVLISDGPYRWSRNPLYIARLLLLLAVALILGSFGLLLVILGLFLILNFFLIPREEKRLEQKFGEDYQTYAGRVGRWLHTSRGGS